MKTKEEIKKRIELLEMLMGDGEISEEVIMSTKQKAKIRIKINVLNWVLDNYALDKKGDKLK